MAYRMKNARVPVRHIGAAWIAVVSLRLMQDAADQLRRRAEALEAGSSAGYVGVMPSGLPRHPNAILDGQRGSHANS